MKTVELGNHALRLSDPAAAILQTLIYQGVYAVPKGHNEAVSDRIAQIRKKLPTGWHIRCAAKPYTQTKYHLLTTDQLHDGLNPLHCGRWNEERFQTAKTMYESGFSAQRIANRLGCGITRNAVIGKMYRHHIVKGGKPTAKPPEPKPVEVEEPPITDPNVCRQPTCTNKPIPNYTHGRCYDCQREYLDEKWRDKKALDGLSMGVVD